MPVGEGPQRLIRSVLGVRGALRFRLEVEPRFGYGLHDSTWGESYVGLRGRN
jgi:hypothetical protein